MPTLPDIVHVTLIGVGATAVFDAWLQVLKRAGVPTAPFALIGRWVGHMAQGRFAHASIARADPVDHEAALGWLTHYITGVAFAGLLVALNGRGWLQQPSVLPALATGLATVVLPLFVMQPAMGAGIASSKTATPLKNCLRSIANHAVFGAGLYLTGIVLAGAAR